MFDLSQNFVSSSNHFLRLIILPDEPIVSRWSKLVTGHCSCHHFSTGQHSEMTCKTSWISSSFIYTSDDKNYSNFRFISSLASSFNPILFFFSIFLDTAWIWFLSTHVFDYTLMHKAIKIAMHATEKVMNQFNMTFTMEFNR